jgi:hypothetical protein
MDVNAINKQQAESRKIQNKILKWDDKDSPLAKLGDLQLDVINEIEELNTKAKLKVNKRMICR